MFFTFPVVHFQGHKHFCRWLPKNVSSFIIHNIQMVVLVGVDTYALVLTNGHKLMMQLWSRQMKVGIQYCCFTKTSNWHQIPLWIFKSMKKWISYIIKLHLEHQTKQLDVLAKATQTLLILFDSALAFLWLCLTWYIYILQESHILY